MSQTAYSLYQNAAFAGMLADISENDIISMSAEAADIPFGKAVRLGTNREKQVIQASTSVGQGALIVGFATASHTVEQGAAGLTAYPRYSAVNVLKRGRFWVETFDAVTAGSVANFHLATGKFTDEAVAAGIEAITQVSVRFVTGTTGAGLAIVEVK
jgi:hypothetical protein